MFEEVAGDLWSKSLRSSGTKITHGQLTQIASEFDSLGLVPPADFLERCYAKQVRDFNTRHSNSKRGPIKSWTRLVEFADKDHLRGMRKLLSRSRKTPLPAVRK